MQEMSLNLGGSGEQQPSPLTIPTQARPAPIARDSSAAAAYRQRQSTKFRGVTKTSGTNSGVEKYDVQFVFCDGGTKKHPKIYGFTSAVAASRAFDILTCRRIVEKGKPISLIIEAGQAPVTNHPLTDYTDPAFEHLITSCSRDDIIYGLKQAAKRALALDGATLFIDMNEAIAYAQQDAEERRRINEPRMSYEPSAENTNEGRKRKSAKAASGGGRASAGTRRRRIQAPSASPSNAGSLDAGAAGIMGFTTGDLAAMPLDFNSQLALAQLFGNGQTLPTLLPIGGAGTTAKPGESDPDPERSPDGFAFVVELCRVAQNVHPELACAADLLRIWETSSKGGSWSSEQYTLPAQFYEPHVEMLCRAGNLREALTVCHGMWLRRELQNLFHMYVTSLTGPNLMNLPGLDGSVLGVVDGGDGIQGNAEAQEEMNTAAVAALQAHAAAVAGGGDATAAQAMLQQPALQALFAQMAAAGVVTTDGQQGVMPTVMGDDHGDPAAILQLAGGISAAEQQQHIQNLYYSLQAGDMPAPSPSLGAALEGGGGEDEEGN